MPNVDVTEASVVVCHVFLTRRGQSGPEVLLFRRERTGRGDGTWDGPAGRLEPGESPPAAAARELLEETGVVVVPNDLAEIHRASDETRDVLHVFFLARTWRGEPALLEPGLAEDLSWHAVDRVPRPVVDAVAGALVELARHISHD